MDGFILNLFDTLRGSLRILIMLNEPICIVMLYIVTNYIHEYEHNSSMIPCFMYIM